MALIRFENVHHAYGDHPLLNDESFSIETGEKICLLGRNGAGKSTLMALLEGSRVPDSGRVIREGDIRIASLPQALPPTSSLTVYEFIAAAFEGVRQTLDRFTEISSQSNPSATELESLQNEIEARDGWQWQTDVEQVITRLKLPKDATMDSLSGGWRRRVALGRALAVKPDLLLLDEPTNHLDIAAIQWLEQAIAQYSGAVLFVTHDRRFVDRIADRIIELDRGELRNYPGNYSQYLDTKAKELEDEEQQKALFDKKLAQEEVWIRQGIKARRTRNEGRVRALEAMRRERAERRNRKELGDVKLSSGDSSGKLVAELKDVSYRWDDEWIVRNLNLLIQRGDKIGLVGPNGCGKSTLIKLILGDLKPSEGWARLGSQLSVAYFDQLRDSVDLEKTVIDNLAGGQQELLVNGKPRHAISYLQDFLFAPQRSRSPAKVLSGGELNRLMLAKLFLKPANLLVLDEPTNDLDMETLELLESLLVQYQGTLLLVSHDRTFLDNVVTSLLVFEGEGRFTEIAGGYEDWETYAAQKEGPAPVERKSSSPSKPDRRKSAGKLSYKEKRELESLPEQLEKLEAEIQAMQDEVSAPEFFNNPHSETEARLQVLANKEKQLEEAFERWEALEAKRVALEAGN